MAKVNMLWPGKPNYRGMTAGYFTFIHHEKPIEYSGDIMRRINFIKENKLRWEVPTRLKAIRYVGVIAAPFVAKQLPFAENLLFSTKNGRRQIRRYLVKIGCNAKFNNNGLIFPKEKEVI